MVRTELKYYQNFSDAWITKLSHPWCSAAHTLLVWKLLPKCAVSMTICNNYLWVQINSWHASTRMQRLRHWFICVFEAINKFIALLSSILEDKCKKFSNRSCDECVKQDGVRWFLINKFMKWITTAHKFIEYHKYYWVCLLTKVGTVVHDSSCLPVMWPRFKSWHWRHLWVGFVVGSLPSSERLYYAYFGFPVSSRPNSNSIRNACTCLNKFLRTPQYGLVDKQITKKIFFCNL